MPRSPSVRIVHDAHGLVVVDKPAGVASQPTRGRGHADLTQLLGGAAHPLHRLDRATSGLVALARDPCTAAVLSPLFAEGAARRSYRALCAGTIRDDAGELHHRLVHDTARRVSRVVERGGQTASLRFRVLERIGGRTTLLEVEPLTGRTHQIRVQLAAAGHPVVGDRLYGGPAASRLMLHAAELELQLPGEPKPLALRAPPPDDFEAVCALWRLAPPGEARR